MKKALLGTVAALALGMAAPSMAAEIAPGSTFSIAGANNITPTQITFPVDGSLLVSTGSFAALGTCNQCVDLNTITYSPNVSSGLILSLTNNGLTATFTLDPGAMADIIAGSPGALDILGTGTATLTGFDPTRGNLAFSTQNGIPQTVTFSATVVAVPEPASLALFGAGLLGFGMVRRRRLATA